MDAVYVLGQNLKIEGVHAKAVSEELLLNPEDMYKLDGMLISQ